MNNLNITNDEIINATVSNNFNALVEDYINNCGYNQKDAEEAARNTLYGEF